MDWAIHLSLGHELTLVSCLVSGHQSGFCMICVMQNHIIQAFANTGNAIKPVSFIRDLKSKTTSFLQLVCISSWLWVLLCVTDTCFLFFWCQCRWQHDAKLFHMTMPVTMFVSVAVILQFQKEHGGKNEAQVAPYCSHTPSLLPVPLPTCLCLPYVLLQSLLPLPPSHMPSLSPCYCRCRGAALAQMYSPPFPFLKPRAEVFIWLLSALS